MPSPETLAFHTANARRLRADAAADLFAGLGRWARGLFATMPRFAFR